MIRNKFHTCIGELKFLLSNHQILLKIQIIVIEFLCVLNDHTTNPTERQDSQMLAEYVGIQLDLVDPKGKIYSLWLPNIDPAGKYSFSEHGIECLCIEAIEGRWYITCQDGAQFADLPDDEKYSTPLRDNMLYKIDQGLRYYLLYVEVHTIANTTFHNYRIKGSERISIGRVNGNDIKYEDPRISSVHAYIGKRDGKWYVQDNDSLNGVYVNSYKIKDTVLEPGDVIYILGLKIIIGTEFVSLNLHGRRVAVNRNRLVPYQSAGNEIKDAVEDDTDDLFNRQPRKRKALKFEPIPIDNPPMSMSGDKMPLMLTMGRNAVFGVSSLMAGNFTSVISTMLFPILTRRYTDKQKNEYEERRKTVYRAYLEKKHTQIKKEQNREEQILRWNYPELSKVLRFPVEKDRLWERQKTDDDFLTVRVGVGDMRLLSEIEYNGQEFMLDEDELEKERRSLCEGKYWIKNVPIQTNLIEDFACGVSGDEKIRKEFVRNMLLQLVMLHSYDEVKIVFLCDEKDIEYFGFVRYIPHIWDDKREIRFLAHNASDSIRISEYLKKEIYPQDDKKEPEELPKYLKTHPYYVVFALDKRCFDGMEILKTILQEDRSVGVSIVAAFDDLPKECSKIFSLDPISESSVLYIKQLDHETDHFVLEAYDRKLSKEAVRSLANTRLRVMAQTHILPKSYTFLEMFSVGKIEYLNIENRWANNNPVQSLTTPIGIGEDGSLFMLDLHQKYHGPHGLVAGTTGSGKSEFLMTYILSMAVNYHPDEVAFVLIDYKGGGLAGAFDDPLHDIHLPHLIATITNLDGNAIQRSLISIESELLRRQKIFSDVKNISGEGTMDIYTYQRLYRNGLVKEPLPHLFIIADEFAELKQKEPEFMEKLISAARIGRSLGIHLILATQKPSGVVNDQIRSNTKFRVCLKVQDSADSNDMLKRPDAAEIKETGRFYLQIGYNEFFALGQSAWSGADYVPRETIQKNLDESIQVLDPLGQNIIEVKKKVKTGPAEGTQLVSIVRHISDIAKNRGIKVRPLWKPPLPLVLPYDEMKTWAERSSDVSVYADFGIADDPHNMEHHMVSIDLLHCGNVMIIGEQASGKTTLLKTMLYDLTDRYSPDIVNFYIIDCSNHALRVFRDTPHCGAWLNETMESDIDRLFDFLYDTVRVRKKLLEEADVSTYEEYIVRHPIPLLLFVIDNMAGFVATARGGTYQYEMGDIIKKCSGLGIQFIFAASHMNDLYTKTKQEIKTRIALEMKDKYSYQDLLNCKCNFVPANLPGRGMVIINETPLEFQTAAICRDGRIMDDDLIKGATGDICAKYGNAPTAKRLPVLNEIEEYADFCKQYNTGRIPFGYSLKEIKPVILPLKQLSRLSVYIGNDSGVGAILGNIVYASLHNKMELYVVKRERRSALDDIGDHPDVHVYECKPDILEEFCKELAAVSSERIGILSAYCKEHGLKASDKDVYYEAYEHMIKTVRPMMVVVESFSEFNRKITSDYLEVIERLWEINRRLCIYYAAGFYPGDQSINTYSLGKKYEEESMDIWMGGRLDKQPFVLSSDFKNIRAATEYNKGIMRYRENIYSIFMPCGVLSIQEPEEDDRSIF